MRVPGVLVDRAQWSCLALAAAVLRVEPGERGGSGLLLGPSGRSYSGGTTFSAHYAADEIPVFVRDGALIPEQEAARYSDEKPLHRIILKHHLVIEPTKGSYQEQPVARSYELRIHAAGKPASSISIDGQLVGAGSWDAARSATVVSLPSRSIHDRREIVWH